MSMWTHLTGVIKIRTYDNEKLEERREMLDKALRETQIPFGTEGGIELYTMASGDFLIVVLNGNLRDVGENSDMSKDGLTSKFSDIGNWLKNMPKILRNFGILDDLLVRYSDDGLNSRSHIVYTVQHPNFLEPEIVIEQEIPHFRALRVDR